MKKTWENADYWRHNDDCEESTNTMPEESKDEWSGVHSNLLISDRNGIYIPKIFMENYSEEWKLSDWCKKTLSDPDCELYWEEWNTVLNKTAKDKDGVEWSLEQDGDLFCVSFFDYEGE